MRAEQRADSNAIWLVKSGDRILGPMTTDEIAAGLKSKEIVIIDEVITPMSRWRLVRDEPRFKHVVEEVRRGQMSGREDTEVQGHTNTGTHTGSGVTPAPETTTSTSQAAAPKAVSIVESIQRPPPDKVTPVAESSAPAAANARTQASLDKSKVVDAEFTDDVVTPQSRAQNSSTDLRQYGIGSSSARRSGGGILRVAWFGAAVALLASAYFYLSSPKRVVTDGVSAAKPTGFEGLVRAANSEWDKGRFAAALKLYRQANQTKENRPEVVARLAPLMIQLEGETVTAKRMLSETLATAPADTSATVKSQLEAGLGLAAMISDDFAEAETRFRTSVTLVPGSLAPILNNGTILFLRKSYSDALHRFSIAGDHPAALLLAARATMATARSAASLRSAETLVDRSILKFQDYRQEALVFDSWLKLESGNRKAALAQARAALDVDPELTNDHWHDPLLYIEPLKWKSLVSMCRRIADELRFSTTKALLGLCLYKAGDREEAVQTIAHGLASDPDSGLLQAMNAFVLLNAGRLEDARAAVRLASRAETPKLALLVGARVCSQIGDVACAEKYYRDLLSQEPPTLAALTGMTELLMRKTLVQGGSIQEKPAKQQKVDRERAAELLRNARSISPSYRPALELLESVN